MTVAIASASVRAEIQLFGAMATARFKLGGCWVDPFFRAPWYDETQPDSFLNNLRGDFVCAPFGGTPASSFGYSDEWKNLVKHASKTTFAHGYPAHHVWELVEQRKDWALLQITDAPYFSSVTRKVVCKEGGILYLEDSIYPQKSMRLPLGLHPIFRLPEKLGEAKLHLPACKGLYTFPGAVDHSSMFETFQISRKADSIPLASGDVCDITSLPLPYCTEELVLLANVEEGKVMLDDFSKKYRVILEWDNSVLKSCLLWFSNRGRKARPWNGTNLCIGIEPVTAAFDLGEEISANENPLLKNGIMTAVQLQAKEVCTIRHQITVERVIQ